MSRTFALAALCGLPALASAEAPIADVRLLSDAILVAITPDATASTRVTASIGDADLACEPGGAEQIGVTEGAVIKPGSALTLSLATAEGKPLGAYEGRLAEDGRLDFFKGAGPYDAALIGGFALGTGAVVTLEGPATGALTGSLLTSGGKLALDFGAERVLWSCATPQAEDTLDLTVRTELLTSPGKSGRAIWKHDDQAKARLAAPWADGYEGVAALPLDPAGLTSLALLPPAVDGCGWGADCAEPGAYALVAVSSGWSASETLPTALVLDLDGGAALSLPLNSAQRAGFTDLGFEKPPGSAELELRTDAGALRLRVGDRGVCQFGRCFSLAATSDSSARLSVTAYDADASALPEKLEVRFAPADPKAGIVSPKAPFAAVALDPEVGLVFGRAVELDASSVGAVVAAKPSLIGLEQDGIHTTTYNAIMKLAPVPGAGALGVFAVDRTGPKVSDGEALVSGSPIGLEREGVGGVTEPVGPPVVWEANGAGTRSAIPSTRNKPGLR